MPSTLFRPRSEDRRPPTAAGSPCPPESFPARAGMGAQFLSLGRYLLQTEVHTYAFSVAANAILSLCPFIVLMLTVARQVFHSRAMEGVIAEMLRYFLPAGQDFIVRNMTVVARSRHGIQLASLLMLAISSTGVFVPLETALNRVWGIGKNRSYLRNQAISFGLALAIGTLAMISVALTAAQHSVLELLFLGHTNNLAYALMTHWLLRISAAVVSVLLFFLIYWILPNRNLPIRAVLPAAVVTGLLWEVAKMAYIGLLPWLDFRSIYGPFSISVSLMMWAFLTGLLLLAGAQFSATRHTLRLAHRADLERAKAESNAG